MPTIGFPEFVVIGMILVLVFGASRLPKFGASLGRALRNLKRSVDEDPRIGVRTSGDANASSVSNNAPVNAEAPSPSRPPTTRGDIVDAEIVTPASPRAEGHDEAPSGEPAHQDPSKAPHQH